MKLKDNFKSYTIVFIVGILAGVVCRLSDFFPYEDLWSLSSIATLYGFWIASVTVTTFFSSSNIGAAVNSFLYMFGMTLSFYGLKYILGFFFAQFDNDGRFQTDLFILYSVLSVACGVGSFILYFWNRDHVLNSILYALPASGLLAEGVGCLIILINNYMLLAQTLFDFAFALLFGCLFLKRAKNKALYMVTMAAVTALVFFIIYKPFLLTAF